MKGFTQENSLNTLNGYIYAIISSPIDPSEFLIKKLFEFFNQKLFFKGVLAISVGDTSIKTFNETQNIDRNVKTYSNNIKTEITQVSCL